MTEPSSMRALQATAIDDPFVEVRLPRPTLHGGQVLVRIQASGVNPLDAKIRAGKAPHARHPLPAILGMDLAGTIEALGDDVMGFEVGDAVYGLTGGVGGLQGSLAEYAAVDADLLAPKPANLSMRQAAALPLVIITAWEGLVDRAGLHAGQIVLVHGGAGGVGHVAVQIARAFDAKVFATVSPAGAEIVSNYGATPIDYKAKSVAQYVQEHTGGAGFDLIYDTVGGQTLDESFAAVKTYSGRVVSCLGWGEHKLAPLSFRAATYSGVFALLPLLTGQGRRRHGDILREATTLIEGGKLAPLMDDRTFRFEDALAAHEIVARGAARGRVVVDIR